MIEIAPYDPSWPTRFDELAATIRTVLGTRVVALEHVGSTAVEGLAAKDVIDIDLIVADPCDEADYAPALEAIGYVLTVREPSFYQHRMFRLPSPRTNLHVFGPDCPEHIRHIMFRDWLRTHPEDRARYEDTKRQAQPGRQTVMDYNRSKGAVIADIYERIFAAAGFK
ncbi:GrpB family protein [Rhodococcus sp. ACT016]|uniref:GrpB family protein n=1 Tax=Rhodococcus sp. ACT016 TaxID=3134808 RepID=UPI003D2A5741